MDHLIVFASWSQYYVPHVICGSLTKHESATKNDIWIGSAIFAELMVGNNKQVHRDGETHDAAYRDIGNKNPH